MVAAFWDYQQTSNPRLPVFLITSDFSLAHVCHAERVPYLFARSPHEVRKQQAHKPHPLQPKTLFFDPFALALRFCAPHYVLWELALIFRRINIVPVPLNGVPTAEGLEPATSEGPAVPPQDPQEDTPAPPLGPFSLCYEGARHWPGEHPPICLGPLLQDSPAVPASANQGPDTSSRGDDGATPGEARGGFVSNLTHYWQCCRHGRASHEISLAFRRRMRTNSGNCGRSVSKPGYFPSMGRKCSPEIA